MDGGIELKYLFIGIFCLCKNYCFMVVSSINSGVNI